MERLLHTNVKSEFLVEVEMENEEVKYYQPRFARWIRSDKWDRIAEKLPDTCIDVITRVMNAEKDGDCSWVIWKHCGYILERIQDINKRLK